MDFFELLNDGAGKLGFLPDRKMTLQFEMYYKMLIEKNKVMNLTAITDMGDVIRKHFLDSISLLSVVTDVETKKIIDIGSGAGFPGIPIKIVCPDTEITLLDSLNKRVTFLNEVIQKLELSNIKAVHGRAEELARNPMYREKYDIAVSRAVAKLNILSEYSLPFVKVGGFFAAYKSQRTDEEVAEATAIVSKLGARVKNIVDIQIPGLDADRKIIFIEKEKKCPDAYPRSGSKIFK